VPADGAENDGPDDGPAGRVWTVRLRRDDRVVLIADDLG